MTDPIVEAAGRLLAAHALSAAALGGIPIVAVDPADIALVAGAVTRMAEALEASVAWTEHLIDIVRDRRIPSADTIADGNAIVEIARAALRGETG